MVEEQPVAIWVSNGTAWWINKEGGLFPARGDRTDLLKIDAAGTDGILGQNLAIDAAETGNDSIGSTDEEVEAVLLPQRSILP